MKYFNRGFNLIELLVATAISVSLTSIAAGLLAQSIHSHRVQKGLAEINESTQFVGEFIRHEFYRAGFSGDQPPMSPVNWDLSQDGNEYDVVAVQRIAGAEDYDCSGAALTPKEKYIGIFSAKTKQSFSARSKEELSDFSCDRVIAGDEINAVSLIYGVKRFQVLYGIEKKEGDKVNYVFMSRDELVNVPEADRHVVSIKIGILFSDTGYAVLPRKAQSWIVLDETYDSTNSSNAELNDGHFHRVVEWIIPLRNVSREIKIANR